MNRCVAVCFFYAERLAPVLRLMKLRNSIFTPFQGGMTTFSFKDGLSGYNHPGTPKEKALVTCSACGGYPVLLEKLPEV